MFSDWVIEEVFKAVMQTRPSWWLVDLNVWSDFGHCRLSDMAMKERSHSENHWRQNEANNAFDVSTSSKLEISWWFTNLNKYPTLNGPSKYKDSPATTIHRWREESNHGTYSIDTKWYDVINMQHSFGLDWERMLFRLCFLEKLGVMRHLFQFGHEGGCSTYHT